MTTPLRKLNLGSTQPPPRQYGVQPSYEMSNTNYRNSYHNVPSTITDMDSFYAEFRRVEAELQRFEENVSNISAIQDRLLGALEKAQTQQQLDTLVAETKRLAQQLRDNIKNLQTTGSDSRNGRIRRKQAAILKERFDRALESYRQTERKYQLAQKQQMERQMRIVKPSATDEEIRNAMEDTAGGPIFQQALLNSDRFGKTREVYQDVQVRHQEILRITQTMAEVQQLINEMSQLVQEQGETIDNIEQTTAVVAVDVEKGLGETSRARHWAQKAREKRVMCFWIFVVILVIIAAVLAIYFATRPKN